MQRQSRRMGSRTEWGKEWELGSREKVLGKGLGSREKVSGKGLGSQEMGLATESEMGSEMGLGKGLGPQEMGLGMELGMGSEMGLGTELGMGSAMVSGSEWAKDTWEGGERRRGCLRCGRRGIVSDHYIFYR